MPAYLYPDDTDFIVTRTSKQSITGQKTFLAESATVVGLIVQGAASQSANLLELRDSAGAVQTSFNQFGEFGSIYNASVGTLDRTLATLGVVARTGGTVKGLVVRASASMSASLQEWQNSAGAVLGQIYADGRANFNSSVSDGAGVSGNANAVNAFGGFFRSTVTQATPLMVRGAVGQAYDVTQWQNSNGNRMAAVDANGGIYSYNHGGLGTTINSEFTMASFGGSVSNGTSLLIKMIRSAAGTDWGTANLVLLRKTDATDQQKIVMTGSSGDVGIWPSGSGGVQLLNSSGAAQLSANASSSTTGGAVSVNATGVNHISLQIYSAAGNSVDASSVLRWTGAGISHGDIGYHAGATEQFRFTATGSAYSGTGYTSVGVGTLYYSGLSSRSTIEIKNSVEPLESKTVGRGSSDKVSNRFKNLRPVKFKYNDDTDYDPIRHGFIAEEVEQVFPEIAVYDKGTPRLDKESSPLESPEGAPRGKIVGYDTQALLTLTVAALQDALARIEVLEAKK